jgi:hypothetical protein
MAGWLHEIDALLRGSKTNQVFLDRHAAAIRLGPCLGAAVALSVVYGVFMGLFAVMTRSPPCWEQLVATAIKVPALFLLTLAITFPSLYVFSALMGTRLTFLDTLRVLVAAVTVNACVLAAFGPITGFFTLNTTSYAFMKLLNVAFFAIAGFLGVGFVARVVRGLEAATGAPPAPPGEGRAAAPATAKAPATQVLTLWLVIYALVGAQMGWVLRPLIGAPTEPFAAFRAREANIFVDVVRSIASLFS